MEKLSIIMPTYNQVKFIKEAIESILNQTYQDWKLYIIDDGCTDSTFEIVKEFLSDKVVYFKKENGGTADALNFGASKSSGIYQSFVSSDNIYFPNYAEELVKILDSMPDVGFVYSDFQYIDENGKPGQLFLRETYRKGMFIHGCYIGLCFMWRKSLFDQVGGWDKNLDCQDYDFALKCEELMDMFHIAKTLGYFRDHSASVSNTKVNTKGYDDTIDAQNAAKKRRGIQ